MIRLIIALIVEGIYFIITLPFILVAFLLGLINKRIQYKIGQFVIVSASWILFKINGADLNISGQEFIPKDETVLFVGNHKSLIDIPLLLTFTHKRIAFISKESMKKIPAINLWTMVIGSLFLDRTSLRKGAATIKAGIKMLEDGHSLVIFPEGTRSVEDDMLPFKKGSMKLATKSGVRVIPFAVKGTNEIFEDHGYRFRRWPVHLAFGEPIDLNALDADTAKISNEYVQNIVANLRKNMN